MSCLSLSTKKFLALYCVAVKFFFNIFFGGAEAPFAAADKVHKFHKLRNVHVVFRKQIQGFGAGHLTAPNQAESLFEGGNGLAGSSGAAQPHEVGAMHERTAARRQHPRGEILRNPRHAADESVGADMPELVHCGKAADDRKIVHTHMPAEGGPVGHDDVVAELAVMGDVRVGHTQVAAADAGQAAPAFRAPVERGEFTDAVIVAEFQPRHFALELEILRHAANQGVGMDMVARTHFRVVFDDGMRVDAAAIPDDDMLFDDRIRAYFHILADLRPGGDYDPLYQSALCRQKADWLIGINASRLFSVLYHRTLNIGRVQTPTLAMLADRDSKIVLFRKEKYHHVRLALESAEAVSDRIVSPEDAQAIRDACDGQRAVCVSLVREKKTEKPPKLYDLTTLQREANRVFGYTAKQTLDYAQSLYEKKLLTYPRTDSRYLTSDMAETASVVLHLAARVAPFDACPEFFPDVLALVNDKEVSDHHAILPTLELEKANMPGLPVGERNILLLVCCKLLCAAAEPFVYEAATAAFDCGGHTFTTKGKQVLSQGWRAIQEVFRSSLKEKPEDEDDEGVLPALTEGQVFEPVAASVTEHFTSPPRPYTEDSLLAAMENAGKEDIPEGAERRGLGTPATRAAIIEKLVFGGFVERKGKNLIPTKAGVNLVTVLPELLTSPKLTADWEQRLNEVAKGQVSPEDFMDGIEAMAAELVRKYSHISEDGQKLFQPEKETVGLCPRCGKPVYEGKKNFACSDRACQFVMWKNDRFFEQRGKVFTSKIATALLKDGKTKVKGLRSLRTGKTYDGTIVLADTGGKYVNYRIEK